MLGVHRSVPELAPELPAPVTGVWIESGLDDHHLGLQ